jgi:hypothetical protein
VLNRQEQGLKGCKMNIERGGWEDFQVWLRKLREERLPQVSANLLFRGHGDSNWKLETTLERSGWSLASLREYYLLTLRIAPTVATFADAKTPDYDQGILEKFSIKESILEVNPFYDLPSYQFMTYLRHHGFPSPLLDWSESPYVASFFAFRDPNPNVSARSIYTYCETSTGVKGQSLGAPTMRIIRGGAHGQPRHFHQQSVYSVCESFKNGTGWQYDSHQHVFEQTWRGKEQDLLWRFDIPSSERAKVLRSLDEFNLNAFTLFNTDDTLLETLWNRERVLPAMGNND